jgi:hypothetical protein
MDARCTRYEEETFGCEMGQQNRDVIGGPKLHESRFMEFASLLCGRIGWANLIVVAQTLLRYLAEC